MIFVSDKYPLSASNGSKFFKFSLSVVGKKEQKGGKMEASDFYVTLELIFLRSVIFRPIFLLSFLTPPDIKIF